MENNIPRKRRAFDHGNGNTIGPALQDQPSSSHTGRPSLNLSTSSLSEQNHIILAQAAEILNTPIDALFRFGLQNQSPYFSSVPLASLNLHSPHHQYSPGPSYFPVHQQHQLHYQQPHQEELPNGQQPWKRPRLEPHNSLSSSHFTGSPVVQEEEMQEKLPIHSGRHASNTAQVSYDRLPSEPTTSSGWSPSRVAGCLGILGCPPFAPYTSEPAYAQPTSAHAAPYHDYPDTEPEMAQNPNSMHGPESFGFAQVSSSQAELFACDNPSLVTQYVQNFPPLQPTTLHGVQPSTGHGMIYPDTPSHSHYLINQSGNINTAGLGIQNGSFVRESRNTGAEVAFPIKTESPGTSHPASFSDRLPHYDTAPAYGHSPSSNDGCKQETEGDVYGRPAVGDNHPQSRPTAKRGKFVNLAEREATAYTRRIGSCIRCRMQRIRCKLDPDNEGGPCLTCKNVATNRVWRLSCLRWKITDVKLYKPGQVPGLEWTNRWKDSVVDDIGNWATSETRTIRVTEGYTGGFVELRVRQFQPQLGDKLERSWASRSGKRSVKIPPFAIVDMESAKNSFDSYITKGLVRCFKKLFGPKLLLARTYAQAMELMRSSSTDEKEKELMNSTLQLWMSVRLTTKSFEIVGQETLGMPHDIIDDQENPLYHKIPLPPVMGAQIDSVLIHQIQPILRRKTLEDLQKMTQEKKQKTWLTTYLVTFILLHNIALITKHDAEYAKKHGMKTRFAREHMVKEYNLGANTLLAYFHYCNKGIYPFSDECRDLDLKNLASLDEASIRFVHETRRYAAEHKDDWDRLRQSDDYENEYYYVSQLFEPNWQPRIMV